MSDRLPAHVDDHVATTRARVDLAPQVRAVGGPALEHADHARPVPSTPRTQEMPTTLVLHVLPEMTDVRAAGAEPAA